MNDLWISRDENGYAIFDGEPVWWDDEGGWIGEHMDGISICDEVATKLKINIPMNSKAKLCGVRLGKPVMAEE